MGGILPEKIWFIKVKWYGGDMKLGILTVYSVSNFGSYLQAYALKNILENLGHEVYHIKTRSDREIRTGFYKYPVTRRSLKHPIEEFQKYKFGKKKYILFQKELDKFNEIEKTNIKDLDGVIVGSDELWNISESEFQYPLYFGEGVEKKATYGISVGKATWEDFEKMPEYQKLIQNVDYITVRDYRTQKVVRRITGKIAPMVCDPTFLVQTDILYQKIQNEYIKKNKYILLYTYNFTIEEWTKNYLIRYAKEKKLKLISVGFYFSWCDYNINCNPFEFSDVIQQAECMVTTTFHGCVLGTLNYQKVLAVPFSPKVNDVMEKLGLSESVINKKLPYEMFKSKLDNLELDKECITRNIEKMKNESMSALKDLLQVYN